MALREAAWNSYSQMSLGLGMIFDGLQCSQHLLGEYRRNHVLISVHSNSSSICLIVNPFSVVPQKKNLCVGVGSLTELEIMVWHRPLASNSLLALSTSKATFQQAFPAIILRATNDVAVIDFNTVGMFEEKLLFRFCVFLISFMKPIKNILRNGTPKHAYNTKADPNLRCSKMFLQHQITVWRQWPYMGA